MIIKHVHLAEKHLHKFLGSLEAAIMVVAWSGSKTLSTIHRRLVRDGSNVSYSSVVTVVDRLVDKGILQRRVNDKQVEYTPVYATQEAFIQAALDMLIAELREDFPKQVHKAVFKPTFVITDR